MIDTALFKQIASETLPDILYQQLEPHLEAVSSRYGEVETRIGQMEEIEHEERRYRSGRYNMIRQEFGNHNEPNWPTFARERWPEIDTYFNLEPKEESCSGRRTIYGSVDDDLPF